MVIAAAGGPEPAASEHRQALLSLEVLPAIKDMMDRKQSKPVRAAALQALCYLALEASSGTKEAEQRQASETAAAVNADQPAPRPAWSVLFSFLPTIVPILSGLIVSPQFAEAPVSACQTLSNLLRGMAFVPRVLKLLEALPALARHIAAKSEPQVKEVFAQMLLNAAMHNGSAGDLDKASAQKVRERRVNARWVWGASST